MFHFSQLSRQDQLLSGSIEMHHSSDSVLVMGTYRKLDDKDEFRRTNSDSFSSMNIPKSNSSQHIRSPSSSSHKKMQPSHSRNSSIDQR